MKERLKKLSAFQADHFEPGSAPDAKTLKSDIDKGNLPGRKIGGKYYIDMAQYEAITDKNPTGNPLVNKVLNKIAA